MAEPSTRWLLLSYKLAREPTRMRLAVWRRLKRLGAIVLHAAVWTVPRDEKTREAFEWLAEEIEEAGGTVFLWEAESLDAEQNRRIVSKILRATENRYATLRAAARAAKDAVATISGDDLESLRAALRQARRVERELRLERQRDFFRAANRTSAERAVASAIRAIHRRLAHRALGNSAAVPR